jgi:magnesium transporter
VDVVDSHRELVAGLLNTYLSALSNRTNEVMKLLTIMASIFIPLTFLAGVYGMNFEAMPELHKPWGYPALLGVMVVTALAMLFYFRHRGWLGDPPDDDDADGP